VGSDGGGIGQRRDRTEAGSDGGTGSDRGGEKEDLDKTEEERKIRVRRRGARSKRRKREERGRKVSTICDKGSSAVRWHRVIAM
jgi:hypothetical protein